MVHTEGTKKEKKRKFLNNDKNRLDMYNTESIPTTPRTTTENSGEKMNKYSKEKNKLIFPLENIQTTTTINYEVYMRKKYIGFLDMYNKSTNKYFQLNKFSSIKLSMAYFSIKTRYTSPRCCLSAQILAGEKNCCSRHFLFVDTWANARRPSRLHMHPNNQRAGNNSK